MTNPVMQIDSFNKTAHYQTPDGIETETLSFKEYMALSEKLQPYFAYEKLGIRYYDVEAQMEAQ